LYTLPVLLYFVFLVAGFPPLPLSFIWEKILNCGFPLEIFSLEIPCVGRLLQVVYSRCSTASILTALGIFTYHPDLPQFPLPAKFIKRFSLWHSRLSLKDSRILQKSLNIQSIYIQAFIYSTNSYQEHIHPNAALCTPKIEKFSVLRETLSFFKMFWGIKAWTRELCHYTDLQHNSMKVQSTNLAKRNGESLSTQDIEASQGKRRVAFGWGGWGLKEELFKDRRYSMSPECMYYENDSHLACLGHRVVGKIN
jgi:hypothetical protein